jgi:hypothetical protein
VLLSGCLALSTNDTNKQFLNRSNLLMMLQSVLEMYVSNQPGLVIQHGDDEESAGGGGDVSNKLKFTTHYFNI